MFAFAHEGMRQSAIAGHMGLTLAIVNRIFWRHAATGTLVSCKLTGASRKTTPRHDHALLRVVPQDRFISVRALTARMRNVFGMRADRKTTNKQLLSPVVTMPIDPQRSPIDHHHLRFEWQHITFGEESKFQMCPVDGRLTVCR